MSKNLVVLINGQEIGHVDRSNQGKLSFTYTEHWRNLKHAFPMSLSMPLVAPSHGNTTVEAFLWGLLPDNGPILDQWAKKFHVSPRNPFGLIAHVGEDCAGAVQFVRPERIEAYVGTHSGSIEWLDEETIANRLKRLRADHSAWRMVNDSGQFSLAGAQPKTALLFQDERWGIPSGRLPTTHILKPPTGAFVGHAENEHFCLALARRIGLPTASSSILHFKDELAVVIERYDRTRTAGGELMRLHQEDCCQAMAVFPAKKYESDGGPGAQTIIELLRAHSQARDEDVTTFLEALAFNWLVAGTDAHAKNYSLLIGAGGRVRLAPLYDLASVLPYDHFQFQKLKLAMRIGKNYRVRDIGAMEWKKFARTVQYDSDRLLGRIREMAERLPSAAKEVAVEMRAKGLNHPIVGRLEECLAENAESCGKLLA